MDYNSMMEDIEKAFDRGEVTELLKGEKGYSFPVYDVPADVPTDWTRIIPSGIHRLYRQKKDDCIKRQFEDAIRSLCGGDPTDLWICAYVLYVQLDTEGRGEAAFALDRGLISDFSTGISLHQTYLKNNKYHMDEITMYNDIKRLDTILKEDYGLCILTEGEG